MTTSQAHDLASWPAEATEPPPQSKDAWRVLMAPHMKRLALSLPMWCPALALFYTALETASPMSDDARFHFPLYLLAIFIGGCSATLLCMTGWYVAAKPLWLRSAEARRRLNHEGMYALLPWAVALPMVIALCLLSGACSFALWDALMSFMGWWTPGRRAASTFSTSLVFHCFAASVIFSVDYFRVRAQALRRRAETAQRLQVEAQLQRLQAQMEPHMLFNTLANLHALIETDPSKAQDMLAHLIDYLRATLSATRSGAATLADEMARVQDYLALMRIRMGDRLCVVLDVPTSLHAVSVPPMLIQPLVENAIKHGLDPLPEGGTLHILARNEADMLIIEVKDNGCGVLTPGMPTPRSTGFGLDCVRARLQSSYGDQGRLSLVTAGAPGQDTIATVQLPISESLLPTPITM